MSGGVKSFVTAVVIALFGLIPLGLMAMTPSETQVPTEETTTTSVDFGELPRARMDDLDERARSVVTTPVPEIDGVTESVARVLAANGFAGEEVVEGIPESIVRVLVDEGAVLTIAVTGDG